MENLLPSLALLACPVGMGLMMWFMAKGMRRPDSSQHSPRSLAELRAEQRRVDAEIERREQGAADGPAKAARR